MRLLLEARRCENGENGEIGENGENCRWILKYVHLGRYSMNFRLGLSHGLWMRMRIAIAVSTDSHSFGMLDFDFWISSFSILHSPVVSCVV